MKSLISQITSNLGNATPFVIVGGGIVATWQAIATWYRRGLGSRKDLARRLNELGCGVTLRYVEERFGTPAFARTFDPARLRAVPAPRPEPVSLMRLLTGQANASARPTTTPATEPVSVDVTRTLTPMREFLYRTKHAWLQVIVDDADAVARFSVTVTDPRFKFSVARLTWGHLAVRLGHSRFSDIGVGGYALRGRSLRIGAHNHEYAEAYYFGYPGFYQHFMLSANEEGTGSFGYSIEQGGPSFASSGMLQNTSAVPVQREFDPNAEYAVRFRASTTVNTLTVVGSGANPAPALLEEPRGASGTFTIPPNSKQWRQMQRRVHRMRARQRKQDRAAASSGRESYDDVSADLGADAGDLMLRSRVKDQDSTRDQTPS